MLARGASLLGVIAVTGCTSATFLCDNSGECPGGTCEATGYCSFPDDECPSGSRYGALAGGGLADECVPEDQGSTGTTGETSTTGSASSTASSTLDSTIGPTSDVTGPSEATDESTGEPVFCGDGNQDPGEDCDDGNRVDGDGCNTDCVVSGSVLWELRHGEDGTDVYRDVVAIGDGRVAVTGDLQSGDSTAAILRVFDTDGDIAVDEEVVMPDRANAWGIDTLTDGDVAIGGQNLAQGTGFAALFGVDGNERWTVPIDNQIFDLSVDGDDVIYLVGQDPLDAPIVMALDSDGGVLAPPTVTGMPASGTAWDVAASSDGTLYVAGSDSVNSAAFIVRSGPMGWAAGVPLQDASSSASYGIRLDGDGNVDVCGFVDLAGELSGWAARLDVARGTAHNTLTMSSGVGLSNIHNVGAGPSGELVAVGWRGTSGSSAEIWVGKFDPELELLWETTFDGTADSDDNGWGIVVDDAGVITAVGGVAQAGAGYDAWIAQLAP